MRKGSKRLSIVAVVLAALLGVSSIALADHEEQRDDDTIVSFGYDELNRILAVNSGDNDTPWVCDFALEDDGSLSATYVNIIDGFVEIESLFDGLDEWEFDARAAHEVSPPGDAEAGTRAYSHTDNECGLTAALVTGKFNHGQFMKLAKSFFDGNGNGCINSELAKSDIGRTDETRLRTPDVEDGFEPEDSGDIKFTTFEADCSKRDNEKGRPDSPGKSGDAPGHSNGDD